MEPDFASSPTPQKGSHRWYGGDNTPLLLLALGALVLQFAVLGRYGYFRDEFYYAACGDHLAWGYVDHPPLIALFARASRSLFGSSPASLRVLPALADAALVFLTGRMARGLGAGRFWQGAAALAALLAPAFLATAHLLTVNVFEQLFWTLAGYLFILLFRTGEGRWWLPLGVVLGLGVLNKHSMLFFAGAVVAGMLLTPHRQQFRRREFWAGAGIGLLLFLPNLLWEVAAGWPTLEFMRNAERFKNYPVSPAEFIAGQVLQVNPLFLPLWLAGLLYLLFARAARPYRPLGLAYVFLFLFFLVTRGKNYHLAPIYPLLFAAGAAAWQAWLPAAAGRWARPAAVALLLAGGLISLPVALPVLPVEDFRRYAAALGVGEVKTERHRAAKLPQLYADMFGWENLVATVARVYRSLPPGERAKCAILTSNYGEAGAIDLLGAGYGLPKSICGHNNYYLWGPRDYTGEVVITVGLSSEEVKPLFRRVEPAATISHPYAMPYESDLTVYLCREPVAPLRELWLRLKIYI
jgi:hypothetical protein